MPPAFVLSQDQTLNKKFNLLLKLLWVFKYFKNSQKNCWIYFNYILFNFQRPYFVIASSDFLILSLTNYYVNTFFEKFQLNFLESLFFLEALLPKNTTYNTILINIDAFKFALLFYLFSLFLCFSTFLAFFRLLIHQDKLFNLYSLLYYVL